MEKIYGPGQGENYVEQKGGVPDAPLRQERSAAEVVRVPKRQFATQKALARIKRLRIADGTKVTVNERIQAQHYSRKRREQRDREKKKEKTSGEPLLLVCRTGSARVASLFWLNRPHQHRRADLKPMLIAYWSSKPSQ